MKNITRLKKRLSSVGNLQATLDTVRAMDFDSVNGPRLTDWLESGIEAKDGRWEIRSALRAIATEFQPKTYLEIGVRRGWSLAQVVAGNPSVTVTAIDMWVPGYGGVDNPGPEFVLSQVKRAVGEWASYPVFLSGDSHQILPTLEPGFDLITVDGDHTGPGAIADLNEAYRLLNPGGFIVFDDLLPVSDGGCSLREAWEATKRDGFIYLEYSVPNMAPCGIAVGE